jgi:hypothetical protein
VIASTAIYIDSNLGNGEKGEKLASRIYDSGFRNIYIATGDHPDRFSSLPQIKGIVGREPPWLSL